MNIFFLDSNATVAASYHCDKHVVKMVLETAQLLSTAHHVLDGDSAPDGIYKATHINHPSNVWIRSGVPQYVWGWHLFSALLNEYTLRYSKIHKCQSLKYILDMPPVNIKRSAVWSDPPQCMPDQFKVPNDTVQAYRNYYMYGKAKIAQWKYTPVPDWYEFKLVCY